MQNVKRRWPRVAVAAFFAVTLLATPALAVIEILYPLGNLITDADLIFVAKVDKVHPEKPAAVLLSGTALKGKPTWERLPINLTGDDAKQSMQLLKRLAPGQAVIVFSLKKVGDEQQLLLYCEGTWFQTIGRADGSELRWAFTHCEPFLRRTYKGSSADLQNLIVDVLAGKKKAPPPSPKEPAGLGPEISAPPQEPKK